MFVPTLAVGFKEMSPRNSNPFTLHSLLFTLYPSPFTLLSDEAFGS
jgi:hypothetical protein